EKQTLIFRALRAVVLASVLPLALVLSLTIPAPLPAADPAVKENDEPIFRAFRDELRRSMEKLRMGELEEPYYIEYYLEDGKHWVLAASLGALVQKETGHGRPFSVRVRVGDYRLDNSNFEAGGPFSGRRGLAAFPIDQDYEALRRALWLSTDGAYKRALETLANKRAFLKTVQTRERIDDFVRVEPAEAVLPLLPVAPPGKKWEEAVRKLSAVFREFPQLQDSSVEMHVYSGHHYLMNSEGSRFRQPERAVSFLASAALQADDGAPLRSDFSLVVHVPADLPSLANLEAEVRRTGEEAVRLAEAPRGEDYSGPVLFTPEAAARVLARLLAPNVAGTTPPERAGGGQLALLAGGGSAWGSKWKARVMPADFEVTDDPTIPSFEGTPLMGAYKVDRESVPAQRVTLVENGRLVNFLMSRSPRRELSGSNGHGRAMGRGEVVQALAGNLFVTSDQGVSFDRLKARLIEEAKVLEKPYGILITKLGPAPSLDAGAGATGPMGTVVGFGGRGFPEVPVLAYRVWVEDGREELVRGLRFSSFTPRSLRDIIGAGDKLFVYNHLALVMGTSGMELIPTALLAPALLFEDLDLNSRQGQARKLPLLPPPYAAEQP
ncbi:MAG: metallopeptidase TldD-related protein, partial [Acidobacteria bacterium]|nr:metallopeptidase TldD-related protein [Acidobacteriota bacterium]